jgi:hypothetical protein
MGYTKRVTIESSTHYLYNITSFMLYEGGRVYVGVVVGSEMHLCIKISQKELLIYPP